MTPILKIILTCAVAMAAGTILGNGAVYFFNRIPGKWLTDYGEEPSEELLHPTTQRIRSVPYKYAFTGVFIALSIYFGLKDPWTAIPIVVALWLLLEMSIADIKYMIVPDQLIMLLVIACLGILPGKIAVYRMHAVWDALLGVACGLGIMLALALLSRAIYKKWVLGGADIKIFAALGLMTGLYGILIIFILSTLLSGLHLGFLVIVRKANLKETRPMVPYIALATLLYFMFLADLTAGYVVYL
ncbi:MAG: A24 family peptidase [Clostridia bacterium]|nr:A24 family peptidase [Clostridia bacterium]